MENKKTDIETQNEDKIGVIPVSQIEGSDADTTQQDDNAADKLAEQAAKSDSDIDEQTGKSNTD
ncbi:hypothetical protein [Pedobacter alluvionis]|uniref:Uncharacterized protein n=1 Tax=Pedobacter alluvionis TaxID=475253 RepID=A0A497Y422_9SPHI|nr:hypothetical protein [Pedobacter alluvionis]RLJ76806.1 hypothetical protein BCL90_1850 [Pedobacter alluvionis]TFB33928.1 hypothetical protein E3V97_07750 [Pedobacter alluvionis]